MHTGERDSDGLPRHRIAAVDVVRRFRTGTSGRHATLLACAVLVAGACGGGEAPLVPLGENPPSAQVLTAPTTAPRTDTNGTATARADESGDPAPSRLPANPAERPIRLHESTRSPLERGGVSADADGWEPSPPKRPIRIQARRRAPASRWNRAVSVPSNDSLYRTTRRPLPRTIAGILYLLLCPHRPHPTSDPSNR